MKSFVLAAMIVMPLPALANDEAGIFEMSQGIAIAADEQDWQRLDLKFSDHVFLNQLSLETDEGARVDEQTVVDVWAELLPRFDETTHAISGIEITGISPGSRPGDRQPPRHLSAGCPNLGTEGATG